MSLKGIFPIDKWDFNSQTIFTDLPPADLELLLSNASDDVYIKGETIFKEGGIPSGIFYIKQGKVKKYKVDSYKKEQIIYVANAGELIGYHAVLASELFPDSASALEESMISFIPKEDFLKVLDQSPLLSRKLLKTLSHEFAVLTNNISIFTQRPVRERVAITLIVLREKFKVGTLPDQPIFINVSREDIASMAGTTRENAVRVLRQFKDEHIIEAKGRKIRVLDVKKLAVASNYP